MKRATVKRDDGRWRVARWNAKHWGGSFEDARRRSIAFEEAIAKLLRDRGSR